MIENFIINLEYYIILIISTERKKYKYIYILKFLLIIYHIKFIYNYNKYVIFLILNFFIKN